MSDITKIDKNFAVNEIAPGGEFYSIDEAPFVLYGVMKDEKGYTRIPQTVADATNDGVASLTRFTSGGIIRFSTNSTKLALKANHAYGGVMPHMAALGSNGFAVYEGKRFLCSFQPTVPPSAIGEEKILRYDENAVSPDGFHEITIYMPLYGAYDDIMVKVDEGAEIRHAKPFRNEKPVVFYGSSITEGGCASTPAMGFTNIVSRDLDIYCLNLGFSGSARGEDAIADYIASLDMSLFVLDYDHNAANVTELEKTHEKMFLKVRDNHPNIPIIIMNRPKYYLNEEEEARRDIIVQTYQNAINAGDKNVYFIDGRELMKFAGNEGTVDNCHPNDLGFESMAQAMITLLKKIL
jgi:hypothetical protein